MADFLSAIPSPLPKVPWPILEEALLLGQISASLVFDDDIVTGVVIRRIVSDLQIMIVFKSHLETLILV